MTEGEEKCIRCGESCETFEAQMTGICADCWTEEDYEEEEQRPGYYSILHSGFYRDL